MVVIKINMQEALLILIIV